MTSEHIKKELKELERLDLLRKLRNSEMCAINLSSNDYLGISNNQELRDEFFKIYGHSLSFSSSSSRLLSGSFPLILKLEETLEKIYGKSALVFNSGYDANQCLIETLFDKNSLIISDRLNHSSLYSGIISSQAKLLRYKHLDLENLQNLLMNNHQLYDDILVITESIYSMDGDRVDLKKMVDLKKKYGFKLLLDEAHSYGVDGYGEAYELNILKDIDYLIIPLGKAGSSSGAYLLTDSLTKTFLVNKGKKFIFTTAPSPLQTAWNLFIVEKMCSFDYLRDKLKSLTQFTYELLKKNGLHTASKTHIISIIIGENSRAESIAENLRNKGFLVFAIKEPTVPRGTARIRISLTADLSSDNLIKFIQELKNEINDFL